MVAPRSFHPPNRLTAHPPRLLRGARVYPTPRKLFAAGLRVEVDERVAAFRQSGPWMHLDDAVEVRTAQAGPDFPGGGPQGAAAAGAGGGLGVLGEELELGGAGGEGGEFDGETVHRALGRAVFQLDQERGGDPG